jgi:hypothetical protein
MNNKHKGSAVLSYKNVFALGLILGLTTPDISFAKNGIKEPSPTAVSKEAEKEAKEKEKAAEKSTKDADKLAKKAAQDAEKAAKELQKSSSQSRIELLAKMKQAEPSDSADEVEVDVSENEASLKYRLKDGKHKLTAEIEGFSDGDIFNMYIVINSKEVLVSKMELISDGTIAAQEIEFDDSTWPAGIPLEITSGTAVKVRDAKGVLVLEGVLASKK